MELDDRSPAIATLRRGLDLGLTHIDTAEMYGNGRVESLVGEAIAGRRDQVFLASKVLPSHASHAGTLAACQSSLRRLKTDRLDLYLLHWPSDEHSLEQTFAAFEELERDGKILAFGVSNFDVPMLERALGIAGERRIACNQVLYHLKERIIEASVLPWCRRHQIAVVGYSPFGSGDFPGARSAGGRVLKAIAGAHGATPRQVALRFLIREPDVFTIPKAARPEHAEENAGALELSLSAAELEQIDKAFPVHERQELPMI